MKFFLHKYFAYGMNKSILIGEKFQKLKTWFFLCPYMLLFYLKSVLWTGNKLVGDYIENCENSQLTLTNPSHLLQFYVSQHWNTL